MPKLYFSNNVQNRLKSLIKNLLACVSICPDYVSEGDNLCIKLISSNKNKTPQLIVQAELKNLVHLAFADDISEQQISRQGKALKNDIRHDLKLLEAIGFLEDHRVKRQGKSIWHFTLKLCSLDPVANFTKIQSQWALYKNNRMALVGGVKSSRAEQTSPNAVSLHRDWSDAPDIQHFFGRTQDLTTLEKWAVKDSCRLIAIVGMHGIGKTRLSIKLGKGGIGKTDLSLQLARGIQSQFQFVIWRSFINAPQINGFLTDLVKALSQQAEVTLPTNPEQKISRLLHYLKSKKCLLILDNLESILEGGTQTGNYRSGYEDYGHLLKQIGSVPHQSCVLLTSREEPTNRAHPDDEGGVALKKKGMRS